MSKGETQAAIRGEMPERTSLGLKKDGNVKFFIDKAARILYSPRFVYGGPTLRG